MASTIVTNNMGEGIMGLIWAIQRFNVHDGDGIRTLVFMKGCPLRCRWCANPEGQLSRPELQVVGRLCIGCGKCVAACPVGAAKYSIEEGPYVNRDACNTCGRCTEVCVPKARRVLGDMVTVDQVLDEVMKDETFYRASGGGITLTGGEPCSQPQFAARLLEAAQDCLVNTAVETSGHSDWCNLEMIARHSDTILYDIKLLDDPMHVEQTGVNIDAILGNLHRLKDMEKKTILRMPIIPGINDTERNLRALADLACETQPKSIVLLPYHRLGQDKYSTLGKVYTLHHIEPPTPGRMRELRESIRLSFPRVETYA